MAHALAGAQAEGMKIHEIPAGSVVVGVDGSEHSEQALVWAADLAAREHRLLAIVHSRDPMVFGYGYGASVGSWAVDWVEVDREVVAAAKAALTLDSAKVLERHPELRVAEVYDVLDPREGLVTASQHARMVVLGSRGRGPVASMLLGSVSVAVTRNADCPVVVIRPQTEESTPAADAPVVAAIDLTPSSAGVLDLAFEMADELGAPLRVVHCVWSVLLGDDDVHTEGKLGVAEALAGLGEKHPDVAVTVDVVEGARADVIVEAVQGAALAVVGHDPASGLHRVVWGSIAAAVVERVSCPVAVVPGIAQG